MAHSALDPTQLDDILTAIEAIPDWIDGIDLSPSKQEARFQTGMARASIMRLRKLATPLQTE